MLLGNVKIIPLADISDSEEKSCVLIGTLYKHQQWKPSILKELSEDEQLAVPVARDDYCSNNDQVFLEDDTSRIRLAGKDADIMDLVTGVVCAVLGHQNESCAFQVKIFIF